MKDNFKKIAVATISAFGLATFIACGDDPASGGANINNDSPIIGEDLSSSSDADLGLGDTQPTSSEAIPGSSATEIAPGSSADAVPGSSDAQPASSADNAPASSSSEIAPSSSSIQAAPSFKFGYALKNDPTPSKGCGRETTLRTDRKVENGEHHVVNVNGTNREYFITLPENYDNNKKYKLLIALHCYGSSAEDFVHHTPDYDHPTPYYGQQVLDKNNDYIYASLQGLGNPGLWNKGQDDHDFFGKALTTIEDNYCIDTSRVFITGFSYGAMFSYSLAQDYQDRVRAAVTYAVADYNIWLPQEAGKDKNLPIAWMNVHGVNDDRCTFDKAKNSALPRMLKKNGKASDGDSQFTDASSEQLVVNQGNTGHTCYDFKNVDERFPIKFCTWPGGHQWTAHDTGNMGVGWNWESTWVPEEVHKFIEQF